MLNERIFNILLINFTVMVSQYHLNDFVNSITAPTTSCGRTGNCNA